MPERCMLGSRPGGPARRRDDVVGLVRGGQVLDEGREVKGRRRGARGLGIASLERAGVKITALDRAVWCSAASATPTAPAGLTVVVGGRGVEPACAALRKLDDVRRDDYRLAVVCRRGMRGVCCGDVGGGREVDVRGEHGGPTGGERECGGFEWRQIPLQDRVRAARDL